MREILHANDVLEKATADCAASRGAVNKDEISEILKALLARNPRPKLWLFSWGFRPPVTTSIIGMIKTKAVPHKEPRPPRRAVRKHGPDPIDVHVGGRLRQARFFAGLSQDELGAGIGVSFQAVQKYEHGENRLSASRLARAAKLLARPVSFFFDGIEDEALAMVNPRGFSRDEIELIRYYRQIANPEIRNRLVQIVRAVSVSPGGAARRAAG
jgi:transcriptional regulator with XRE-family HTH domain